MMKTFMMFVIAALLIIISSWLAFSVATPQQAQTTTPNSNLALEARVTVLEGQVKELRRVVGIEGGLKEGLQFKKNAPVSPKK